MSRPSSPMPFKPRLLALSLGVAALAGCSTVDNLMHGQDAQYQSAKPARQQLDVPPDLTQMSKQPALTMPAGQSSVSAVAMQSQSAPQQPQQAAAAKVLPQYPGMHIEQAGGQRWLLVDQQPDQLWDKVQGFWQANGLYLSKSDPKTGEMETDWAENRAKLPLDFIRRSIGKVFDNAYDTGERDSYRALLQRSPDGKGTEIFITHRTMVEVYTNTSQTTTMWQPGTPDPGMDLLFLQRLMVHLGMGEDQAKAAVEASKTAAASPAAVARASLIDSGSALQINDGFDEAWRRVSLAVNTAGFTVTDRDRSAGRFDVRFVDPAASLKLQQEGESIFSKWFGNKSAEPAPQPMHIQLQASGSVTRLTVLGDPGNSNADASRKAILDVLLQQLK